MKAKIGAVSLVLALWGCAVPRYEPVTPELRARYLADLQAGNLVLTCQTQECAVGWIYKRNEMIKLHNAKQWESLAELVMQVGFTNDLGYLFLGRSAIELGHRDAALKFFQKSADLYGDSIRLHHCRDAGGGCGELDLGVALPKLIGDIEKDGTSRKAAPGQGSGSKATEITATANSRGEVTGKNAKPVTKKVLENAQLPLFFGEGREARDDLPFKKGKYRSLPVGVQAHFKGDTFYVDLTANIFETAFGDLNGDGVDDGVYLVAGNSGGSGIFVSMGALLAGFSQPLEPIYLGDRTDIKSISITSGNIVLEILGHGPNDGLCCPSEKRRLVYSVKNNSLVAHQKWKPDI